jgi:hypothetical protein
VSAAAVFLTAAVGIFLAAVVLWPPIITGYQLEGLKAACMSGNVCIVVLFDDTIPKVSVIGDIDLAAEHE